VLERAKSEPSAVLFCSQLAAVLVYPFMDGDAGRAFVSVLGIAFLGLVVLAVRSSPALTWLGLMLAVPASALLLIQAVTDANTLVPYSSGLEAALYFYAAGALIAYMLADHVITRDELWAVGATFTLVAWGFAYTYTVCQAVEPASFGHERTWMELLFLSFTTLSSTGLSDIAPARPFARSLNMLEQLAGLAYVAMVVSRLVGLLVRSRGAGPPGDR
jgi:hypothetical protein